MIGQFLWSGPAEGVCLYRAEALAEGLVINSSRPVRCVLGTFMSPYPGRVLRWLRGQALRIADGLDPDPVTVSWSKALHPGPAPNEAVGDVPSAFRAWAQSDGSCDLAQHQLANGATVMVVGEDHTGWYALTAWLATTTVRSPSPHAELHLPVPLLLLTYRRGTARPQQQES